MYKGNREGGRFQRDGGRFQGGSFAPVKVGEELEVSIEAVGEKGDGIAKKNGFVIFIPGAKQGETAKIRITRVLKKVGFAELVTPGSEGQTQEQSEETAQSQEEPAEEATEEVSEDSENFGEEEQ